MCASASISGWDERFCLPLAPPGQLHAWATCHHWPTQPLPRPPQLPQPHCGDQPAHKQKAYKMVWPMMWLGNSLGEMWQYFCGKGHFALSFLYFHFNPPSCGLTPSYLAPKTDAVHARMCMHTGPFTMTAAFQTPACSHPACVPGPARGFLSSRKLLLPFRPLRETERKAYWSPSKFMCRSGQPHQTRTAPAAHSQPDPLLSAKPLV